MGNEEAKQQLRCAKLEVYARAAKLVPGLKLFDFRLRIAHVGGIFSGDVSYDIELCVLSGSLRRYHTRTLKLGESQSLQAGIDVFTEKLVEHVTALRAANRAG